MPQATQEQIDAWKKQHGDIFEFKVGEDKYAYLKKPDRKTMGLASALQANPVRSNEAILKGCWIGGDEEIQSDNDLFASIQGQLGILIDVKAVEVKKL